MSQEPTLEWALEQARLSLLSSVAAMGNFGMAPEHHATADRCASAAALLERSKSWILAAEKHLAGELNYASVLDAFRAAQEPK